jgi:hypothetical protein
MNKSFFYILTIFTFYSCSFSSKEEDNAIQEISSKYVVDNITISHKTKLGNDKQYISITLEGTKLADSSNTYQDRILSTTALILYTNLKPVDRDKYESVTVTIKTNDNTVISHDYDFNQLLHITKTFDSLNSFCKNIKERNYINALTFLDPKMLEIVPKDSIIKTFITIDNENGNIKSYTLKGFKILKVERDNQQIAVLKTWAELNRTSTKDEIIFFSNYMDKNPKIIELAYE